jgi:glucose-1-phosphate thymidylyltransferase
MKGIILAAGRGTRLYPMTKPVCKPLLPVYDKPMIYYPLSVLLQAGCEEIMIIIPPGEQNAFENLLGDGTQLGISIVYAEQTEPRGIADALLIAREFSAGESVCLILGDNIFHSPKLEQMLRKAAAQRQGATVFGYWVKDPHAFGVVEFDDKGQAISIEEKPRHPKSHYIIPGLYFYDAQVMDIAQNLKPSARGELEITDVNIEYMRRGQLRVIPLDRDFVWMDTGTAEGLHEAAGVVRDIQERTGRYVGCVEEIAHRNSYITEKQLHVIGDELKMTLYGQYLLCM